MASSATRQAPARKTDKDRGKRSADHRAGTADERSLDIHKASTSGSQTEASRRKRKGNNCKLYICDFRGLRCKSDRQSEGQEDQES